MKDTDDLNAAASSALTAGDLIGAERLARTALQLHPADACAALLLGIVLIRCERFTESIPILQRATKLDPSSFEAPYWLSTAFRRMGHLDDACKAARLAVERSTESAHAHNQLGMCQLDFGQPTLALECFQRACDASPNVGGFFDNLGLAFQALGRNGEAISAFQRVLEIGPVRPAGLYRLGDAYMMEPNPVMAAECARAILQAEPNSVQGNLLMARALIGDGSVEEGAKFARRAVDLAPNNPAPLAYYARAAQSLGKIDEAEQLFRRLIELEPKQGFGYHSLVHNHKVQESERPMVEKMRSLAKNESLPLRELIQLEYGLGKALEDLGEYEEAMTHFDRANEIDRKLKVGVPPFRPEELRATAKLICATFDRGFFSYHVVRSKEPDLPIFVVGMMRSGTTLAEQILSSHRDVGGAGEQLFWPDRLGVGEKVFRSLSAERWESLDIDLLRMLSGQYLHLLRQISPGSTRVVDKMNTNYLLIGLLHVAFPNARFIHMRRHPVDTCISIWATPVANGVNLCANKQNVVSAYEQYLLIMDHWRSVIPPDRLMDIQYETLVSDRERVTKQMVEFCGLDWDEACMSPESNVRSVKTPSVWQVRQPVYKTSIARWKKYEPWLGPFADLFDKVDLPD